MSESGQILVPIDLGEESSWTRPLSQAFDLAGATGASVTIMTVVPEVFGGLDWRYAIRGETGGSEDLDIDALLTHASARVEEIGRRLAPDDATEFDVIVRYGTIYEAILDVAKEIGATQIVMGAHRPSLSDYLLGPNTARVVRHATCSVQVVR